VARLERRLFRERAARKEAEHLIELKSRELWEANQALEKAVTAYEFLSSHDALTGLANRRMVEDWMDRRKIRLPVTGHLIGVISLDMDHFKSINDTLGHAAGDDYIKEIAARLMATVRGEDLVVRFGGDEILILLNGVRDVEDVLMVAEKLRASIGADLVLTGTTLHPTASQGVTVLAVDEDPEQALQRADEAMYAAKAAGRDRAVAAPPP
jgi:diguanylate cyclase (GGDEF)-like protein